MKKTLCKCVILKHIRYVSTINNQRKQYQVCDMDKRKTKLVNKQEFVCLIA